MFSPFITLLGQSNSLGLSADYCVSFKTEFQSPDIQTEFPETKMGHHLPFQFSSRKQHLKTHSFLKDTLFSKGVEDILYYN